MKIIFVLGVALILRGAAVLGFDQYSYTTRDNAFQIGQVKAIAEQVNSVSSPSIVGWLFLGGGACALAFATLTKKT